MQLRDGETVSNNGVGTLRGLPRWAGRSPVELRAALVGLGTMCGLVAAPPLAAADGTLSMRGVYYKERATRVVQPMLDTMFDVGTRGVVTANFLVDAITSASASSGAADDAAFTETRYEVGAGYTHELPVGLRLGAQGRYSTESDYRSIYGGVRAEIDLAQKNATLGVGGGIGRDRISAGAAQGPSMPTLACEPGVDQDHCFLTSYVAFATASQVLSKNAVAGVSYDLARLDGYQSNPYRSALADDGVAAPERHPLDRLRQAFAGSLRYHLAAPQLTVIGAYRYYRDDWNIRAHTPEVRLIQQVGTVADATLRYRYHHQSRAFFYQERYATTDATMQRYLSDDVKLDAFTGHLIEAKLGVAGEAFGLDGRWSGARFEGILQYLLQHERFGNAAIAHVALTVPFDE